MVARCIRNYFDSGGVEEKVKETLVSEAQEAVQETQKAIASIKKGNKQDALMV
jgi:NADH:ubiquinone oxidoreductase subunit D